MCGVKMQDPAIHNSSIHTVLLVGYGGANNTGADVRLMKAIEDVRECFGKCTRVTVATLDKVKTARIVREDKNTRVVRIPKLFLWRIFREAYRHDVTMLVEGSTFVDHWSCSLFYLFMWAAFSAKVAGRKSVAYAVDAGKLGNWNRRLAVAIANRMAFVITRTEAAKAKLETMGVTAPIHATADLAVGFLPEPRPLPRAVGAPLRVAVAPIEFFHWPVRLRGWGKRQDCYSWPYYFTWTEQRKLSSSRMIGIYSRFIERCAQEYGAKVTIVAMEELDTRICEKILETLPAHLTQQIEIHSSSVSDPFTIVRVLRNSDYLITSRYHASVLSLPAGVPQIAIGHDDRLETIYEEYGLRDAYFLKYTEEALEERLWQAFLSLMASGAAIQRNLLRLHEEYFLPRRRLNIALLTKLSMSLE